MTREDAIKALNFLKNSIQSKEDTEVLNMAIKALEQEPVIDKIRAEIEQTNKTINGFFLHEVTKKTILSIIDKYKA